MDIDSVRMLVEAGDWYESAHFQERLAERGITIEQVLEAIRVGRVIQELPPTGADPECIVCGDVERQIAFLKVVQPLYIVCAVGDVVTFVTADWNPPREFGQKRRRRR
ncbi:MAG: DUF4258 domain-containing protein [Abditibacteriales bacterium]|nr:DUF4258 domain-containing protein [Abditibacteriales bacterium]MDW8367650.1 DUF4258 domain-containing protein [Abditibacteriales bacterium]